MTAACTWCPRPAPAAGPMPACATCSATAITSAAILGRHAEDVQRAMAARGMVLRARTVVKLRTQAALHRAGLFKDPHQLGVTTARLAPGRPPSQITIALAAGMPAHVTRAVLAHEYCHALLMERAAVAVPELLNEGLAEFLAHTFLTRDDRGDRAREFAGQMLASPDPVYGEGLRLVRSRVADRGFAEVWRAIVHGGPQEHADLLGDRRPHRNGPSPPPRPDRNEPTPKPRNSPSTQPRPDRNAPSPPARHAPAPPPRPATTPQAWPDRTTRTPRPGHPAAPIPPTRTR